VLVQVRLATGAALACILEGGPQKAFLAIAEKSDSDKQPARLAADSSALPDEKTIIHAG